MSRGGWLISNRPIKTVKAEYHNVIPFEQATTFMDEEKNQKLYNLVRGTDF